MAPASKADKKAAVDAAAWMFNVVTSVGIIIVNKALMATYGFSFGKFVILCTVSDVNVTTKGFVAAFIAVWSTALQQY
ncbi:Nucleotide-sugar transporter family protein, partial [Perilla frutescens var. frutescens]